MRSNNKALKLPKGFRQIPSFPRYGINRKAEVFSLVTNRLKKVWENSHGYMACGLQDESSKTRTRPIHILLAETFIGKRPNGYFVCHIDGNQKNNSVSNLKYALPKENARDRLKHGTAIYGEKHPASKLRLKQIEEIRKEYFRKSYHDTNARELAKKYGVTRTTIVSIANNRTWNAELVKILGN